MKKKNKVPRINILNPVLWIRSKSITRKCKVKLEKINVGKLKPPYIILSTHGSVMDYFIAQKITYPHSMYNVCEEIESDAHNWSINHMGGRYYSRYNSKYDINSHIEEKKIKDIKKAIKRKKIVVLYPEVGFSLDGTDSVISDQLAHLLKELALPVLILKNQGSYLHNPVWSNNKHWNIIHSQLIGICDKDSINSIEEEELDSLIRENFRYDDYSWQRNQALALNNKDRCDGIENILYKCPQCLEENKIISKGDKIYCSSCGKQWVMTEYGDMKAMLDNNEYIRIHDWFSYERDCVREEIIAGNYNFVSKVRVETINTNNNQVISSEAGIMWHNSEGFILKFNDKGKEENIIIPSSEMYSCHIEFDYKGKGPCIALWHDDKLYYVYPQGKCSVTKIMLATEEIYKLSVDSKVFVEKSKSTDEEVVRVDVEDLIESEEIIEEENKGKIIAVEYTDDNIVTSEQAQAIRAEAQTVETNEVS